MADNNTFVLFEEIKNKLETIYRELKELKEGKMNLFLNSLYHSNLYFPVFSL